MTVIHKGNDAITSETGTRGPSGGSDGRDVTSGGGIERVNAFDGLFLRAEHLHRIQDYAHELTTALGAAGGPGVVEGYGVAVEKGKLVVKPGLAVDAAGRPLRSHRNLTLGLAGLEHGDTEFYYIEIHREEWDFGSEAVQGILCEDPCTGGGTARPYQAEGVLLRLELASEPELAGVPDDERRSWLASRLFAAERAARNAWPDPDEPELFRRSWSPPDREEPGPAGVRLGILRAGGEAGWSVDVWAARRDRGAPPPVRGWQYRLGMRPWDVYIAQILQFQHHLRDVWVDGSGAVRASYVAQFLRVLDDVGDKVMKVNRAVTRKRLDQLTEAVKQGKIEEVSQIEAEAATLPSLGIRELPPAGFLPRRGSGSVREIAYEVTDLLGGESMVDVRVCTGALGDVGGMIDRAQHRDRIRLVEGGRVPVDVLTVEGKTKASPDWVVFARREEIDCGAAAAEPETEPVEVYIVSEEKQRDVYRSYLEYIEAHRGGKEGKQPGLPEGSGMTLTYPARTWALPDDEGYDALVAELRALMADGRRVHVVSIATDDTRRTLAMGRGAILVALCTESGVEGPRMASFVGDTEAIVVLHGEPGVPAVRSQTRRK